MADEDDVNVKFGASIEGLSEGVSEAKEKLEGLEETFKHLAEIAGITIGVDAFKEWVKSSAELGEQMERTAAMLGITAKEASELSGMATMTGTDFGALTHTMERFELGLDTADMKTSRVGSALKALGLNSREFIGVPLPQQLETLSEAFSRFADGPTKTAAAMALLGRAGAEMLPFLDRGKEGMEELRAVLERTGAVMSEQMVADFATTKEHLNELSLATDGFSNKLFAVVRGPIDAAIQGMAQFVESLKPETIRSYIVSIVEAIAGLAKMAISAFEEIKESVEAAIPAIKAFGDVVITISHPIDAAIDKVARLGEAMLHLARAVLPPPSATGASNPFGDLTVPKLDALGDAQQRAALNAKAHRDQIDSLATSITNMLGRPSLDEMRGRGLPSTKPKPAVPAMDLSGPGKADHTGVENAEANARHELETWEKNAQEKTDLLNQELASHKITMGQWLAQTKDALGDEAQDTEATYAAELKTVGLTYKQIEDLKTEEARKLKEIAHEVSEAETKAAKETEKSWDEAMKTINHAFESQINALLTGTETWHTAFKKVITDLTEQLLKFSINTALTGIENIGKSALGIGAVGGDGAQIANTSALTGLSTQVMALIAVLTGNTAATTTSAAATTASAAATTTSSVSTLANTISTDANTIATDFQAAVASIGKLFGFAEGTPYVPSTGLALLHQGEMVVPSHLNPNNAGNSLGSLVGGGSSGGSSGGDTHVHLHMPSVIDSGSMRDLFHQHADHIASALHQAVRNGSPSALRLVAGR